MLSSPQCDDRLVRTRRGDDIPVGRDIPPENSYTERRAPGPAAGRGPPRSRPMPTAAASSVRIFAIASDSEIGVSGLSAVLALEPLRPVQAQRVIRHMMRCESDRTQRHRRPEDGPATAVEGERHTVHATGRDGTSCRTQRAICGPHGHALHAASVGVNDQFCVQIDDIIQQLPGDRCEHRAEDRTTCEPENISASQFHSFSHSLMTCNTAVHPVPLSVTPDAAIHFHPLPGFRRDPGNIRSPDVAAVPADAVHLVRTERCVGAMRAHGRPDIPVFPASRGWRGRRYALSG